jgi:predicted DNA-binding transcriptional regulator AlpA
MTRLLRFRDLKSRGVVNSWPMLRRRIERDNFPAGFMLGKNSRAWTEQEVDAWLAKRPVEGPSPRGIAKIRQQQAREKRLRKSESQAQAS